MSLISYMTRTHFADGIAEDAVKAECLGLSINRPLVVTDKGVVAAGLLDRMVEAFSDETPVSVFGRTPQNPTERACVAGLQVYRDNKCDGLVALGGGSSIDLAKAIGVLASHGGELLTYMAVEGGQARIRDIIPPLIAIPTTAGTGSEVGRNAVIAFDDGRKLTMVSPYLVPKAAICDPTLTLSLPAHLTAATGMDAITHCVETYIAMAYNPPADGIAIEGLRRAAANIREATANGSNLDARREMMAAALNGALAFQKGLGGANSMSHALGGLRGHTLHHGMLNAVLLPHVIRFNAPAVGHRYATVNAAMGLDARADTAAAVSDLTADLGLPTKLSELGISLSDIEVAAPLAEKDHTNPTNPRKAGASDYRELLQRAF